MRLLLLALAALPLAAAIDGTVVNKTSGKPQAGAKVSLVKMSQNGMEPAGSATTGADGVFKFEAAEGSPYLLQVTHQEVAYNTQLMPGAPTKGLEIAIFDVAAKVPEAGMSQHMILVETDGQELVVNESYIFTNPSTKTWQSAAGTLHFTVPAEAGANVAARCTSPGGMPLEREPKKGAGFYYLDFPVKPGETRFDISYKMPAKQPLVLTGKVLHEGPSRLVVPQGMQVEGPGLKPLGKEPQSGADILDMAAGAYELKITGAGALRASSGAAQGEAQQEEDGPRIEQILPPGYSKMWKWALGLMLGFLTLSFAAHYLKTPAVGGKRKA